MQAEPAKAPYVVHTSTKLQAGLFLVGGLALVGAIFAAAFLLWSFGRGGGGGAKAAPDLLATGGVHSCLVRPDASVACWGINSDGQVGDGFTSDDTTGLRTLTDVIGLSDAAAVTAGNWHTCALKSDGTVWCWGRNFDGQLGDESYPNARAYPLEASLDGPAQAIDAGQFHTCALMQDGGVECWGANVSGQIGSGVATEEPVPLPTRVEGLDGNVAAISAGGRHTCVLMQDGGVKCWGGNAVGQLGDGTALDSSVPVDVQDEDGEPLTGVVALSAGWGHTCALVESGDLKCWGLNDHGQLGNGRSGDEQAERQAITVQSLGGPVSAITGGGFHTCALLTDGRVQCWGNSSSGELGNELLPPFESETVLPGTLPVDVEHLPHATLVRAGDEHTCAMTDIGVLCWGNHYGFQPQVVSALEPTPQP